MTLLGRVIISYQVLGDATCPFIVYITEEDGRPMLRPTTSRNRHLIELPGRTYWLPW